MVLQSTRGLECPIVLFRAVSFYSISGQTSGVFRLVLSAAKVSKLSCVFISPSSRLLLPISLEARTIHALHRAELDQDSRELGMYRTRHSLLL